MYKHVYKTYKTYKACMKPIQTYKQLINTYTNLVCVLHYRNKLSDSRPPEVSRVHVWGHCTQF